MSRTYRRDFVELDYNDRPFPYGKSWWELGFPYYHNHHTDYYSKRNRKYDHKAWYKSNSPFKKVMKKARKAKERAAMQKKDYEKIPIFRRENDWHYN